MGQKVHPIGFRVGITKKHQSLWFARFSKYKYSQSILEDQMLRKTLSQTLNNLFLNETTGVSKDAKKTNNRLNLKKKTPILTNITIERNLIPYQIVIGIHAKNCHLFKKKLIQLTSNSLVKSNIKTASETLNRARYFINEFKIKTKKINSKKINIKKTRFNKRKKILSIYNKKTEKKLIIKKKGNKIIANLTLNENFKIQKTNNQKKQIINKDNLSIKKPNYLLAFKREFVKSLSKKKNKIMTIIVKKTLHLSKNKKKLNINLLKNKKTLKNSSKNIIHLRKTILGKVFKNSSSSIKKKFCKSIALFKKFENSPNFRVRLAFRDYKETIKSNFFKKKNTILKVKKNFSLRMKKKVVRIYLNNRNNKFIEKLKYDYTEWYNEMMKNQNMTHFNFLQKWRLTRSPIFYRFLKTIKILNEKNQFSLNQKYLINGYSQLNKIKNFLLPLKKLLMILKKKIHFKFTLLKKEFLTFEKLPKIQSFAFCQVLYYFNYVKKLVNKLVQITKRQLIISKFDQNNNIDNYIKVILLPFVKNIKNSANSFEEMVSFLKTKKQFNKRKMSSSLIKKNPMAKRILNLNMNNQGLFDQLKKKQPKLKSLNQILIHLKKGQLETNNQKQKLNIKIKTRRMKFMSYIKDIIQKHRTKNLYFYLPIIAEARRKVRENNITLQRQANKFFGSKVHSIIKENIILKKEIKTVSAENEKIKNLKKKLTPCIDKILKRNYRLKIQKKETTSLLRLRSILEEQLRLRETLQFKSKVKINFFAVQQKNFLSKASTVSQSIVDALETRQAFRQVSK
jgi:hypothetical protein